MAFHLKQKHIFFIYIKCFRSAFRNASDQAELFHVVYFIIHIQYSFLTYLAWYFYQAISDNFIDLVFNVNEMLCFLLGCSDAGAFVFCMQYQCFLDIKKLGSHCIIWSCLFVLSWLLWLYCIYGECKPFISLLSLFKTCTLYLNE